MSLHVLMKRAFGQANRSDFHNSVAPIRYRHDAPQEAGLDVLGSGIVVGLFTGTIFLMRLILAI